jgi:HAMP domain-containing protein
MDEGTQRQGYDNFSPVTVYMQDTLGVMFLAVLALGLFVALLRAQARLRELAGRVK